MCALSRLSKESRLSATMLLACWLLLPVATGGERDRVTETLVNPLRWDDAAARTKEWGTQYNVLRSGPANSAAFQPAGTTASAGLPKRLLVVPEYLTASVSPPAQTVAGMLKTAGRGRAELSAAFSDSVPAKKVLVVPEGSTPSVTAAASNGERRAESAHPSTSRTPAKVQVAQAARRRAIEPVPLRQTAPVAAPVKRSVTAAQIVRPEVSVPPPAIVTQVSQPMLETRVGPRLAGPHVATVTTPVFLAQAPRGVTLVSALPVHVEPSPATVAGSVGVPQSAATYAAVRQPLVLAQAPRPSVSMQTPSAGVRLAQAVTEVAPRVDVMPQRSPSDIELPNDDVIPMDEGTPLTDVQPQMWSTGESACRCGVMCADVRPLRHDGRWSGTTMIPWQLFAHGEYVGPARLAHVPVYRLRVDDMIRMVYGFTGQPSPLPYRLAVGDVIQVESNGDPKIDRSVTVQPDGMVTLRYLGQVRAAGYNLEGLQKELESRYGRFVREPAISLTPVKLNSRIEELRQAVDQRYGAGGQGVYVRVTPAGTVQLPSIGSIPVQGLTLEEVKREIEARYAARFWGVEVTPVLDQRAPRYLFVLGEVRNPGRYELVGPTTALQAIAMAGGWNVGAELKQAVVFRRDECWRLMATRLHLCGAVRGTHPCPADEIWLRDSDILLVPKSRLLETDDMIELLFTRGLYGVVPFNMQLSWTRLTTL